MNHTYVFSIYIIERKRKRRRALFFWFASLTLEIALEEPEIIIRCY